MNDEAIKPEVVADDEETQSVSEAISQPTKLIRIASMTRAMLDEVRQAPIDEKGRARLIEVHGQSLEEMREVLSDDLLEEFNQVMVPLQDTDASEAEIRIAQAQLIGWLEGLFHGIQASLFSQQVAAQNQLAQMQRRALGRPQDGQQPQERSGLYL
ncbi:MAG TPA: proteasome activator [Acidimicrobiia bacterium]|nr:proteasome activator [Acidimicrobiia bacterium]